MILKPLTVKIQDYPDHVLVRVVNSDDQDAMVESKFMLDPYVNVRENIIGILKQRIEIGINITEVSDNPYNITLEDIQPVIIEEQPEPEEVVVQTQYDPMSLINGNT